MVEYRAYSALRIREKRSFKRAQNKKKRSQEQTQQRRDDRAAERERLAIEDPAALEAKRATRLAKHKRKLARRAAAEAAATVGASTQVLGDSEVSELAEAGASTEVLGDAEVGDLDWGNGCEGYSDDENFEYDLDHVVPDEGFISESAPVPPSFKSYYLKQPMIYISVDFEGRYDHSGAVREAGITVMQIDDDAQQEIKKNPTELPSNTRCYCLRVQEFVKDCIPGWARGKGLQVKKFKFGNGVTFVARTDLSTEISKIVENEKAHNVPIRLVVHSGKNEDGYCARNGISAFDGLWDHVIDTQRAWESLDPINNNPGLANLTDNFLKRTGNLELDSSMVHNAGNDSYLTMLLVGRLIERAFRS